VSISAREFFAEGTSIEVGRADDVEPRCVRTPLDLVLTADLIEAASDLSSTALVSRPADDDLGLSLALFGILDRIADRIDLEDSFVSERLKEGYDLKPGSLSAPASFSLLPLEGWFPIVYASAVFGVYGEPGYNVEVGFSLVGVGSRVTVYGVRLCRAESAQSGLAAADFR
jgi:hypothetical protein